MADTYRGLTIRIGGDATSLQKALRSVNSSISATEQQLRKMKQALKMDPDNIGAIETNLRLVGQRAVEAQQRLAQLKRSYQEISNQKVELFKGTSAQTIRQLADATEDANARAAEAKRNYAEVVEQLARVKNEIKGLTGIDLDDELNPDETVEAMRQLGMVTDDIADKYAHLRSSYQKAFDENEIAKQVAGFKDLEVEITRTDTEAKSLAGRFSELSRASHGIDFGEGIDDQLRRIDAAAESVNDEMRRLDSALKLDDGNVETLALKLRDMQEASTLAERKVDLLRQKLERMDAAGVGKLSDETHDAALAAQKAAEGYDEATKAVTKLKGELSELESRQSLLNAKDAAGTDEYRELGDQIRSARTQLDRLVETQREAKAAVDTSAQVTEYRQLQTEISEARAQQSKLNDELEQMGRFSGVSQGSLVSLGMSLSTTVTPAITAMGYGMVSAASEIDAAYRDMRKTVNGTEEDFEGLRQSAIEFSSTNVTSADQILAIQAIGGELGVATEDLKVFAETVSNLDVATNLSSEEAATSLGQLDNILSDLGGETMPNFADALVRLGNNGASTEDQITNIASRIGAMASIVGMSTPEILAWSSTIASTGQGAEAAGTAISRTISDIESAVARGGDSLEGFAKVAGMSAEEFAEKWESSPSDALHAFIDGLNEIEDDGGSAVTTLQDLGINAVRQTQAIQGLMQMIDGLDDNLEMSGNAWNGVSDQWGEAGDAAREAERKAEGFSGSLAILQNMAQNVGAELGDSLVPVINGVTDVLGVLYDAFVGMPDSVKQGVVAVGAFAAALGPLLLLGKGVNEFFGGISDGVKKLKTLKQAERTIDAVSDSMEGASVSAGGFVTSLKGLAIAGGVGLAVAGVTALVSAIVDEQEQARLAERATDGLREACAVAGSSMGDMEEPARSSVEVLAEMDDACRETRQRLASLADEFDEINAGVTAQVTRLDSAQDAIESYNGKSELTAQQVGELKSAVALLNDSCGTNYEVIRDSDGAYKVMQDGIEATIEDIDALIKKQRQQVQEEAQNRKLAELYEEQGQQLEDYNAAYEEYAAALARQEKARQAYVDEYGVDPTVGLEEGIGLGSELATEYGLASDNVGRLGSRVNELGGYLDGTNADIDTVNNSLGNMTAAAEGAYEGIDELVMSSSGVNTALGADSDVMLDFSEALEKSGMSLEDLSELSDRELSNLATLWKSSGNDMSFALEQLGIHADESAAKVKTALEGMSGGEVAAALEASGVNVYQLSEAMAQAGISAETLNEIGSENFAALAANCGGNIDTLIWMLQNYNGTPIYDKNGNITSDDTQLIDSLGNIYVWNGTTLTTKSGAAVVAYDSLKLANDEVLEWNSEGLPTINGTALADSQQIELANGEMATWNGTELVTKKGTVIIHQQELTDCLGNTVEYNDTTLKPISGNVYCDYDELTAALGSIESLRRQDGYTATVRLETVRTTRNRVVNETTPSGASSRLAPASYQAAAASIAAARTAVRAASAPAATATAGKQLAASLPRDVAAVARAVADDPGRYARSVREVVETSGAASTFSPVIVNEGADASDDVVRAILTLQRALPSIISENAPEATPRQFIRAVNKAVRQRA